MGARQPRLQMNPLTVNQINHPILLSCMIDRAKVQLRYAGRRSDMFLMITVVVAAILVGLTLSFALADVVAGEDLAEPIHHTQARFDVDSIESRVQAAVIEALILYQAEGTAAFDLITPTDIIYADTIYPFILDAVTLKTVANGAYPDFAGEVPDDLKNADRSTDRILADLDRDSGTWVEYMASNPDTGVIQLKRSYLYLHDGYIFGSGHYLPESKVKYAAEDAVQLYESKGQEAFEIITPESTLRTAEPYPFVFNASTLETVAHGAIPDRVGHKPYSILNTGDRPIELILADLERDGGTWVEYVFTNPATETPQVKRTWMYLYDGYIFNSGYYLPDYRIQAQVEEAHHLYRSHGTEAFEMITPESQRPLLAHYPFVVDANSLEIVAHGALPGLVGTTASFLEEADRSLDRIMLELNQDEDVWVAYMAENPGTRTPQLTRTYLYLYDEYIFGSGYYLPDSRIQSVADAAIYTYRQKGTDAFDNIINGDLNRGALYPFVRNSTSHMVAIGQLPHLLGTLPTKILGLPANTVEEATNERGQQLWSDVVLTNPDTGTDQVKRAWRTIHDGHYFGSSYTIPDAGAQSMVDYGMFIYESNKENNTWIDIITPDKPVTTDELYLFVINATSWTRLADGVVPDRVGKAETILDTSGRSVADVLADLEADRSVWVTYTFHNPSTGTEQLKRTYLQLRDGLVFGSGYYLLDSQVQAIAHSGVVKYKGSDRDVFLANTNAHSEETVSTYLFVVDPETGDTQAQNVDPTLIGMPDWDAITSALSIDDILKELETEPGVWASYTHTNPVTGETEGKRTWLITHDDFIFGSGYYSSDIPETDVQFVVDNTIRVYESNKENNAWIDIITPDESITTHELYPFVIDAASWTRLADGVVPDRVGKAETILDTSGRSVADVLADLEADGSVWVTYNFHNPSTDTEQLKRTYLKLQDGLVFGSGYYVIDSRVQAITYSLVLEYINKGKDATFAHLDTVPEESISTYTFVVDPKTGDTEAQNVDPALIGMPDWDAITSALSIDDILKELETEPGVWASYTHTNPVTGEMEGKRTWLITHDDLIFGSGYYSSLDSAHTPNVGDN